MAACWQVVGAAADCVFGWDGCVREDVTAGDKREVTQKRPTTVEQNVS